MSLPEFSIHRPVTILMGSMIAILLGAIAFMQIPVDLMPETVYPTLSVTMAYEGVAPEEMETLVTRPLEETLSSTPGIERITSSSFEGTSQVRLEFMWGTNLDEAANEIRSRLDRRRNLLPEDAEPPTLYKFDVTQYPIMFATVAASDMDPRELRHFAEKNIQYRIERAEGIAQARVSGGLRRQIQVELDLKKLRALNLSVAQVVATLRRENLNRPVGPVREGRYEVLLRTTGEFRSLEDILNVGVATRQGVPVYLRDVAEVKDTHEDVRYIVTVDGNPAVRLFVYKQSGANTVAAAEAVREEMLRIERDYPNIQIDPAWDSSEFIKASINNVQNATLQGGALAILVLLFFLRSFSSTLIIGTAIPICVISTFALMFFNGFTLNTVSFGGLALGVGMLVDSAIVVLENIYRHREAGADRIAAAVEGSREVATAIIASTLTTIAVFVPVLFMGGMSAQTFKQLAWVVSFSLLASLIVALTVVPTLCARFLGSRGGAERGLGGWAGRMQEKMADSYAGIVEWSLSHRIPVVLSAVLMFAGSLYIIPLIGVELEPEVDEGQIDVDVELEPGTRVEVTHAVVERLVNQIREVVPEARYIMTEAGSGSTFRYEGQNQGEMRIDLVPVSERNRSAGDVAQQIRGIIQSEPGLEVRIRVRGGTRGRRGSDDSDRLSVQVRGHEMEVIEVLAEQVLEIMRRTEGAAGPRISRQPGFPEMLVSVDRAKATSLGLSVAEVADTLETAVGGTRASMFREQGDEYDILVRLREEDRLALSKVGEVPIILPDGSMIRAESVTRLRRQEGPTQIYRIDQERSILVSAAVEEDYDMGTVVAKLRQEIATLNKPDDYEIIFGGEYEEQQEAFRDMTAAAILALVLVYMVMASQFESLRDPFIILFSIPLAAIGVTVTLLLTDTTFNMQGFLGMIVLVGIVVNNAIVLIDYTNLLRRERHMPLREAVITAGQRRLRPILMTTITTVLGLTPMALGIGEGSELQVPLARVVIGGLTASTMITLVFIPVVYYTAESFSLRKRPVPAADELQPAAGD